MSYVSSRRRRFGRVVRRSRVVVAKGGGRISVRFSSRRGIRGLLLGRNFLLVVGKGGGAIGLKAVVLHCSGVLKVDKLGLVVNRLPNLKTNISEITGGYEISVNGHMIVGKIALCLRRSGSGIDVKRSDRLD